MLFDIVKNATKNSQSIHYGLCSSVGSISAIASLLNPGYVFPISTNLNAKSNIEVGCSASIANSTISWATAQFKKSTSQQLGRITSIKPVEVDVITSSDPNAKNPSTEKQTLLCLVFDKTTVNPFYVRKVEHLNYANDLSNAGYYTCVYVSQGTPLAGETTVGGVNSAGVLGKHDGSITSNTNGKHPYRVQGLEMMYGITQYALDVMIVGGNGTTSVILPDGTVSVPTTSECIYFYCPSNIPLRSNSNNPQSYINSGYKVIGVGPKTSGYVLNVFLNTKYGVWYPTHFTTTSSYGHTDYCWINGNPSYYYFGGDNYMSYQAGSAALGLPSWDTGNTGLYCTRD